MSRDSVVRRFREAWSDALAAGDTRNAPSIREYIQAADESDRTWLFRELLSADISFRDQATLPCSPEAYAAEFPEFPEFPEFQDIVDQLLPQSETSDWEPYLSSDTIQADNLTNGNPAADTNTPQFIGKYRIISFLDRGGQADVYRAIHPTLERELVIKVVRQSIADDARGLDALRQEGRLLAQLEHRNLAHIYDLDFHDGQPFLVMEYVRGRTLQNYMQTKSCNHQEIIGILQQIAEALEVAHRQGIVHRDIKPENILIDHNGAPKLIDFGLARVVSASAGLEHISGTIPYMAPEQAAGNETMVDPRTDVFSLGAILYWAILGKPPFGGSTPSSQLRRARACQFDREALDKSNASKGLKSICLRALSKDPAARFDSAETFGKALTMFSGRWRRRAAIVGAALLATAVIAGISFWPKPSNPPINPRSTSVVESQVEESATPSIDQFSIRVADREGGELQRLDDLLPLRSGNVVNVKWELPSELEFGLFWYGTEGKLFDFTADAEISSENDGIRTYRWPANQSDQPQAMGLAGRPGTEFIFVCARRDRKPTIDDIKRLLDEAGQVGPLAELTSDVFVTLQNDQATLSRQPAEGSNSSPDAEVGRSPSLTVQTVTEEPVLDELLQISRRLASSFEVVQGCAFPHRSLLGSPKVIQQRYALLVGCTSYPNLSDSLQLQGPANDVPLFQQMLIDRFGFTEGDITNLTEFGGDATLRPTKENILRELDRLAESAQPGTLLVLLLSGHGSQQPDGDVADHEVDGLDEVFCAADVARIVSENQSQIPGGISDDNLYRWAKRISDRGAFAWVVRDTCHAGTGFRGNGDETPREIPAKSLVPARLLQASRKKAKANAATVRGAAPKSDRWDVSDDLPRVVVMYASQANEATVEKSLPMKSENARRYGLFTYVLVQSLRDSKEPLTYRQLLNRIRRTYKQWGRVSPTPSIEGGLKDQLLLGAHEVPVD